MKTKGWAASFLVASFLILLAFSPVAGSPSLSLQSKSRYHVSALLNVIEDCTSENATVAVIVCGSATPYSTYSFVNVRDDSLCSPYGDPNCDFASNNVTILPGGRTDWANFGHLNHTVTSDSGLFDLFVPVAKNGTFPISQSFTFMSEGTFRYFCSFHPWMTGTVNVVIPPKLPPKTQSYNLEGFVEWTVVGLGDDDALLSIWHDISIFDANSTPPKLLFSDTGTVEQAVNLKERTEEPGLSSIFQSFPFVSGFPSAYGSGNQLQAVLVTQPYLFPSSGTYTVWWVNGPLELGSTVELLTGYASVRDEASVSIAGSQGSWDAWVVQSRFVEKHRETEPLNPQPNTFRPPIWFDIGPIGLQPKLTPAFYYYYPPSYTANSTNAVKIDFSYGKLSDLLLKAAGSVDSYNELVNVYPPGFYIYGQYGSLSVASKVEVTHTRQSSLSATLDAVSTNLDPSVRMSPPPGGELNTSDTALAAIFPMVYGIAGGVAAILVSGGVWVAKRSLRKMTSGENTTVSP